MILQAAEENDGKGNEEEREEGEIQARGAKGFVEDAMNQGRSEGEGVITLVRLVCRSLKRTMLSIANSTGLHVCFRGKLG